jgi:hypothetical protein
MASSSGVSVGNAAHGFRLRHRADFPVLASHWAARQGQQVLANH